MADELEAGFAWQVGVWERMAEVYQQEIDRRFAPVIQKVLDRAEFRNATHFITASKPR